MCGTTSMTEAKTILIAVEDGVLADSLRFSLELESFDVELCDEHSLPGVMARSDATQGCVVLDQDVFARIIEGKRDSRFSEFAIPIVLMVEHKTERVMARAKAAGVIGVLEKPILGGMLFDAIRTAMDGRMRLERERRPS